MPDAGQAGAFVTDGDGSLNSCCPRTAERGLECVLVTDGDGSLNAMGQPLGLALLRASSSPTGMGVSTG